MEFVLLAQIVLTALMHIPVKHVNLTISSLQEFVILPAQRPLLSQICQTKPAHFAILHALAVLVQILIARAVIVELICSVVHASAHAPQDIFPTHLQKLVKQPS